MCNLFNNTIHPSVIQVSPMFVPRGSRPNHAGSEGI